MSSQSYPSIIVVRSNFAVPTVLSLEKFQTLFPTVLSLERFQMLFPTVMSLVVMAKAVTHKFVISMVEDFLRLDWPLIDHSGIVWIMDQRKFIGFAIIWTRII